MYLRAQASLEYLMTYGWALIIVAVIVAVLVFVVGSPASNVTFSSSDPTKILVKAGAISGSDAEIRLQNITGGSMNVTDSALSGAFSGAICTLNDLALPAGSGPIEVVAGGEMDISCSGMAEGQGTIILQYTDYAGLQREVDITAGGGASTPGGPTDYIAYYALNEESGTTAGDSSGNGNDGTLYGPPTWEESDCMGGNCLSFDSDPEYVEFTGLPVSTTAGDNTTVVYWMYWDGTFGDSWNMPFNWSTRYETAFNSSGHFGFNTFNADLWGISSGGLEDRWVHVAAIFFNDNTDNGLTESRLFIDGTEQTLTQRLSSPDPVTVSSTVYIGRSVGTGYVYPFRGKIDELKIYNRPLSASEICELCNALGSCSC